MENFNLTDILSQKQLPKKKFDKLLKEFVFHNNRNTLTGYPIEFLVEDYSSTGGDKDTLVLIMQCNKSVSGDISNYMSGASNDRRRSSMNPTEKKPSPVETNNEDQITPESVNAEVTDESHRKNDDVSESAKLDDGGSSESINDNEVTETHSKNTSAPENNNADAKTDQDCNNNEVPSPIIDDVNTDLTDAKDTDIVASNETAKDDSQNVSRSQESNDTDLTKLDAKASDANQEQEEATKSPIDKTLTEIKEDLTEESHEMEKPNDEELFEISDEESSDDENETNEVGTHVENEITKVEELDTPVSNENESEKDIDESTNENHQNDESATQAAEQEMQQELETSTVETPKKLMTQIAEEAAGIIEKRGVLNLSDDNSSEDVKVAETNDQNDDTGARNEVDRHLNDDEVEADKDTDANNDNDKKDAEKQHGVEAAVSREDDSTGLKIDGDETTFSKEDTTSESGETDRNDKNDLEDSNTKINKETSHDEKDRSAAPTLDDEGEDNKHVSLPEEDTSDHLRVDHYESDRHSRNKMSSSDDVTSSELTNAERAYINEGKTFHGRQCRRRRIRRVREEEGEYLDTHEVIARIRQKTAALLERQGKMMSRY